LTEWSQKPLEKILIQKYQIPNAALYVPPSQRITRKSNTIVPEQEPSAENLIDKQALNARSEEVSQREDEKEKERFIF
jgi:hypothetical protein